MDTFADLTDRTTGRILAKVAELLAADPERHLAQVARIAQTVATNPEDRRLAAKWRSFFETSKGADPQPMILQDVHRAFESMSPNCRTRLITNLVVWTRSGAPKRARALEEVGAAPFVVLISPTMRCNLSCAGCYAGEYSHEDDLPMEIVERIVEEARDLGTFAITLLGGEPFIRADILDLFDRYPDMTFQVFTNGTLMTEEIARRLERAGNALVCFSIDGFETEHDERRGDGCLHRAEHGMSLLRDAGVPFGFSTMVTSENWLDVTSEAFVDYLIEQGCLWGWHFLYMPVGKEPDLSLMPTPEQREYLRVHGAARIREDKPLFVMDFWNDAPYVGGCIAAGKEYLHVNSNGDVEPCIFTHFARDNIKDKSLAEALKSPFFTTIRSRQPYSDNLLRPCMLIDNTDVARQIIRRQGAHATHPGADELLTTLAGGLDAYAAEYKVIADHAWARNQDRGWPVAPGSSSAATESIEHRVDRTLSE
jgi:MoaA/NifB/PqqE/SkfB family radical SAM enzyme